MKNSERSAIQPFAVGGIMINQTRRRCWSRAMRVTDLELQQLVRVEAGDDPQESPWESEPWNVEHVYGDSTRRVSQTLGRLRRKGLLLEFAGTYVLTLEGYRVLMKECGVGGRLWGKRY